MHDAGTWHEWVPAFVSSTARPERSGKLDVHLLIRGPRPLHLRLLVQPLPDGVSYVLVEGDASTAYGTLTVTTEKKKCRVDWTQEIAFPVTVPQPLMREYAEVAVPRWIEELEHHLTKK